MSDLRERLLIEEDRWREINRIMLDPDCRVVNDLLEVVEKFGGPEAINRKAEEAGRPENLRQRLREIDSPYLADIDWLEDRIDRRDFVSMDEYCAGLGLEESRLNQQNAVTMEISPMLYFPWLRDEAERAIKHRELMPGRFVRLRNMAEQSHDQGDIFATALAMRLIGASYVETLDTKGTDGGNLHTSGLFSLDTIVGHYAGIGQPNRYPLKWVEEFLHYYTPCGVRQVLNYSPGTILIGQWLHRLGVDHEFKVSVLCGLDNPWSVFQALVQARLLSRPDGSTSMVGFNFCNSVDNETIYVADEIRRSLGLTDQVRFEHHITEPSVGIVRHPYLRRRELVELARRVPNLAAKHEGGDPEDEMKRDYISDMRDYFWPKAELEARGLMPHLRTNYLDKHVSLNRSCRALLEDGTAVTCAANLH